jgi:release factor glutamine methyltransferase
VSEPRVPPNSDVIPFADRARPSPSTLHPPPSTAWTIGGLLNWTARFLAERGAEFPRLDTEVLLAHSVGCRRIDLYTRYDEPAPEEMRASFKAMVRRRLEGCPVAYLVGHKEFFSLDFEVNPAVLIPRPESEFVVLECLQLAREMSQPRVVDIGTGSGNIAVALAKQHCGAHVTAIDLSEEALHVARRNAERHGVAERMRFLTGDLFGPLTANERFDFVLSNPPYIAHDDLGTLPPGVRDYEPHVALDGGPQGYRLLERLAHDAPHYLKPGGYLIVEIGAPQEMPVRQRILAHPGYELAETIHDYSGHPRVLSARWRPQ